MYVLILYSVHTSRLRITVPYIHTSQLYSVPALGYAKWYGICNYGVITVFPHTPYTGAQNNDKQGIKRYFNREYRLRIRTLQ